MKPGPWPCGRRDTVRIAVGGPPGAVEGDKDDKDDKDNSVVLVVLVAFKLY
jgi:hypothetical protein